MPVNMSYCRFENTLAALQECRDALDDAGIASLSGSEQDAADELIDLCRRIANDYSSRATGEGEGNG